VSLALSHLLVSVILAFSWALVGAWTAQAAEGDAELLLQLQAEALLKDIRTLTAPQFAGRRGQGARKTAEYLASQFQAAGWKPILLGGKSFLQPFTQIPEVGPGANVIALWEGSDPQLAREYILLGAHFDHLGVREGELHPGADDNASGTSALLAAARLLPLRKTPPRRSILLVGFDQEEDGLLGARHFLCEPPVSRESLKLSLILDMIGRDADGLTRGWSLIGGSEHAPSLRTLVRSGPGNSKDLALGFFGLDVIGMRSDYGPFVQHKLPVLFFGSPPHRDYHAPGDTPERLQPEQLAQVARLVLGTLLAAADANALPVWQDEADLGLEEVQLAYALLGKLLDDRQRLPDPSLPRSLAVQLRAALKVLIERGQLTPAERRELLQFGKSLLE